MATTNDTSKPKPTFVVESYEYLRLVLDIAYHSVEEIEVVVDLNKVSQVDYYRAITEYRNRSFIVSRSYPPELATSPNAVETLTRDNLEIGKY